MCIKRCICWWPRPTVDLDSINSKPLLSAIVIAYTLIFQKHKNTASVTSKTFYLTEYKTR